MSSHVAALRRYSAAAILAVAVACSHRGEEPSEVRQPVIYGADDRQEPFEAGQPDWLATMLDSRLVALGFRDQVQQRGSEIALLAPSFQERFDVCESERFSEQPSFATCSGILFSRRYLLTAGHCTRIDSLSEQLAVGKFFFDAPGVLHIASSGDAHLISTLVTRDDYWDYAWLELAEPLPVLAPMATSDVHEGDPIVSVNHSAGLPAKVQISTAVRVTDEFFYSALDLFNGASGGPVLSSSGALLGVATSGASDYVQSASGCLRASQRADTFDAAVEQTVRVATALAGLCKARNDPEVCPKTAPGSSCAISAPGRYACSSADWVLLGLLIVYALARGRSPRRSPGRDTHRTPRQRPGLSGRTLLGPRGSHSTCAACPGKLGPHGPLRFR
jgi:hypothetical protein